MFEMMSQVKYKNDIYTVLDYFGDGVYFITNLHTSILVHEDRLELLKDE